MDIRLSSKELFADVLTRSFRSTESVWTLSLDGESISYYPWSGNTSILSLFDITRGYDRHLYDVISPAYLPRDQHFLLNISRVSFEAALAPKKQTPSYVTSPILWISSNCHAPSNRTGYMKEFMSLTPVDAWGSCEKNKGPNLPPEIAKIQRSGATENHYKGNWVGAKKEMMKYYHFTVAFENSFDNDYVTEKLWQPLAAGSVPLYYGPPNVEEWLPCSNCIIDLRRFSSIREAVWLREDDREQCHSLCRVPSLAWAACPTEISTDSRLFPARWSLQSGKYDLCYGSQYKP